MRARKGSIQLILMMVISIITQFIVLGKAAAVAGAFGTGTDIDAYNAVHSIANFLFSFISSGITTVLIPAYMQKKKAQSIDSFLTLLYLFGILAIVVTCIVKIPILKGFSSGQTGFIEIGASIFLITMLSQFFNTVTGVTAAFFQVTDRFNIPKVCTLLANIALLLLIVENKSLTIKDYAFYMAVTTVGNAVLQLIIAYRFDYRYSFCFHFSDDDVKTMINIFLPTVFSAGLYQVNLLTDSFVSSRLGAGQISILSYANQIVTLVNALLITNIITFLYPRIARSFKEKMEIQQKNLFEYIFFGEAVMALLIVGFFAIGKEAIMLLFEHGKFSNADTNIVYACICLYMVGFPLNIVRDLIYRFFYAKGNTKATFKNSVIVSCANFVISIILAQFIGIYGVIIGTLLSSLLSVGMIFWRLCKHYGFYYHKKMLILENLKVLAALIMSLLAIQLLKMMIDFGIIANILLFGTLSVAIFGLLLLILRSQSVKMKL